MKSERWESERYDLGYIYIDCGLVLASRLEFRDDYMLCTNDMENTDDSN
jgi:hypothetical protein